MKQSEREAILHRIRALQAKTVANGCTESEALAAAEKVGELLDRYALTLTDFELRQSRCQQREATDRRHDVDLVADAIACSCSCRVWFVGGRIQYFGLPLDVVIAAYMTDLCRSAMDASFRSFLSSPQRPRSMDGRSLRKPYMVAMAYRLSERIEALATTRKAKLKAASGTALILTRKQVVEDQYAALGLKLRPCRASRYRDNDAARAAGRAAGDRVNLTQGIRGAATRRFIR